MNEQTTAQRGIEAQQVLENEAFKDAMRMIKEEIFQAWKDCPVRDAEGQVLLLQLAKLADKFESKFVGMVEGGKLASRKLELNDLRNESAPRRFLRNVAG